MYILFEGVVGSTAYGLATPTSDIDTRGVYVAPLNEVIGLSGASVTDNTIVKHNPDVEFHELGKFCRLALKCNPTVLEQLFLDDYTVKSVLADRLIRIRRSFLFEKGIRGSYGAYARAQAERLLRRNEAGLAGFQSDVKTRTAKHGRHTMRLLLQGMEMLNTGRVTINVGDKRDYLFEMGELAANDPIKFTEHYRKLADQFDAVESVLPAHPDRDKVNQELLDIRWEVHSLAAQRWL